jgi:4a-hydroxytetrahydrobiopterin dehydratase
MTALAEKKCAACDGGAPRLDGAQLDELAKQLMSGWKVVKQHQLERELKFKNFREALDFTNKVGELAEAEGHHPDIFLAWGQVKVTIWTHSVDGLTEGDFVLAAKIDKLQ